MMENPEARPLQEICFLLRWKDMFVHQGGRPGDEPCWCAQTAQCVGPDGRPASEEYCIAGRPCFTLE